MMHIDDFYANAIAEMEAASAPRAQKDLSRRSVMKYGAAGAGLMLAFNFAPPAHAATGAKKEAKLPNLFVQIAPDGTITLYNKNAEMGQGIKTSFPLILAEELDADWKHVKIEQTMVDEKIYGPQWSGGSMSTNMNWNQLRLSLIHI